MSRCARLRPTTPFGFAGQNLEAYLAAANAGENSYQAAGVSGPMKPAVPAPLAENKLVPGPVQSASAVGLRYVSDDMPGISREISGNGFRYRYATDDFVRESEVLERINSLAIPPAWTQVWICPDPCGHLQATGRD